MADSSNEGKGAEGKGAEGTVSFDQSQQKYIDEVMIPKIMGRAGAEHRKAAEALEVKNQELSTKLNDLETKLKTLEVSKPVEGNKDDKDKILNELEEVKRVNRNLQQEREEFRKKVDEQKKTVEETNNRMLELKKRTAIHQAASKQNFRDLKVIEVLTSDNIQWDQEASSFVVVNDKGTVRMNSMMDPLSLEEYYREVAESMKYLVNGDVAPGAGSTESNRGGKAKYKLEEVFGPKSDARKAIALKRENPELYQSMRQQAVEQGMLGR
jgi:hypothetical protein